MKRSGIMAGILAGTLALSQLFSMPALADSYKVVTLGANLSEEQKASILRFFGVNEGEVEILVITNEDEREQLQDLIPIEQIGTRTFSCALVNPTASGGIQVKTANMNYVTSNMIASTLSTSGVINCDVLTAAPFEVSGTGALTGVMMAYETASGETLDEEKKELANEELVTTNEIAQTIGQDEATLVVNDIKIHIIRDEIKEQTEVNAVVDDVVDMAETSVAERAAAAGEAQPKKLGQEEHERLYSFGYKVAQAGYKYDDVKVTLQRVAQNVTESTGIEDPIMDTFEEEAENTLAEDSILRQTDDEALGEDTNINATNQGALEDGDSDGQEASSAAAVSDTDAVSFTKIGTMQDARWIYDTNRMRIMGDNGYAMADVNGNALTGALYRNFSGARGYITASENVEGLNKAGMLSQNGQELLPFQYGYVDVENRYWALGFVLQEATADNYDMSDYNDGYYLIDTVDLYYLGEESASLVATLSRSQINDYYGMGSYINIEDRSTGVITCYDSTFQQVATGLKYTSSTPEGIVTEDLQIIRENGQQGFADRDGNVLMKPSYKYVQDRKGEYVVVSTGEKEGLVDLQGNVVVAPEYDSIQASYSLPLADYESSASGYVANGYIAVEQDGKLGFCDVNGNLTCEPKFAADILEKNGASAAYTDMEGKQHILAADGVDTALEDYAGCSALYYGSGMLYEVYDEDYNYGLIDWHGNVVIPPSCYEVSLSANGRYLLVDVDGTNCEIYEISYNGPVYTPQEASAPAEPVQETETPAPAEPAQETEAPAPAEPAQETEASAQAEPVQETETLAQTGEVQNTQDADGTQQLLSTAAQLLSMDFETNKTSASILLEQAAAAVAAEHPETAQVLESAVTLLDSGAGTADSVGILIDTARKQLEN